MARCDQGYLCRVCGEEVEHITDSELYLRYVIGEVDPEILHTSPECHLRCAPAFAQFVQDDRFESIVCDDPFFSKNQLDASFVKSRTELVSRGYARLWELRKERRKPLTVIEYPLREFRPKWKRGVASARYSRLRCLVASTFAYRTVRSS
jgi:hypothetical protein